MQCKEIEAVLENEGLRSLPEAARAHVAYCHACHRLVEDFSTILAVAEELPREVEPPSRVWVALRNQLEAEGIIKTPAQIDETVRPSWWESLSRILRGRALATAAVGLVIVAAAVVQIQRQPSVSFAPEPFAETAQTLHQEEQSLPMVQQADFSSQDKVDSSLRQNLASLNQFIDDCRRRLRDHPNDELAREYLSVAYQQKAELLSAMLDRGRSVN
jgi:hypothetical protein